MNQLMLCLDLLAYFQPKQKRYVYMLTGFDDSFAEAQILKANYNH